MKLKVLSTGVDLYKIWGNQNIVGKKVAITGETIGVSQLLEARVWTSSNLRL